VEEPPDNWIEAISKTSSPPTGEGIVIDIGTGDGRFVSQSARENPKKFFIGIDANPRALEKISEKIHRKPARGGLPNVLFLQAAVEDLPTELDGVADEIHVHFPWGSLLRGLALGEQQVLANLRRVCARDALLEVVIGVDAQRDQSELERLEISEIGFKNIGSVLVERYRQAGFEITESGESPPVLWSKLHSTWAKRLKENPNRSITYLVARAI
jgi:16S rRNA (adenine(1408)-N(1))-methyltransferase